MAYWFRKGKGSVYVYSRYTDGQYHKEPVPLPRKDTNHLDAQEDINVDQWVKQWAERWEKNTKLQPSGILLSNDLISSYPTGCIKTR